MEKKGEVNLNYIEMGRFKYNSKKLILNRKRRKVKRLALLMIAGIMTVLCLGALIETLFFSNKGKPPINSHKAIASKVKIQDKKDRQSVKKKQLVKVPKKSESEKKHTREINAAINTKESLTKQQWNSEFSKDVFIGDSITDGLSFYGYVKDENVYAQMGILVKNAPKEISNIKIKQPRRVFILLGVNDIDGVMTPSNFTVYYGRLVEGIKKKFPSTKIYVESIFPVLPRAAKVRKSINNSNVTKFNSALMSMCKKRGLHYLNIGSTLKNVEPSIYEADGIHLKAKFYPIWLSYIKNNL